MILEEFDNVQKAVINPWDIIKPVKDMPRVAVTCYSQVTLERIVMELDAEVIAFIGSANGRTPIYRASYKGIEVALFMISVGAAASAGVLEEVFAMGVQKVIVFGTCGVLDKRIEDCSIIIPESAIRDEGTSYHYAKPSDEISVNKQYINTVIALCEELHVKYTIGKAWTTDAFYRETPAKVKHRKEQGCICVDMECSANTAVAQFRNKELIQFFYAADNLDAETWDCRSLSNHDKLQEKDRIGTVALELAVRIH